MTKLITIGKIGTSFGVRGWSKINSYTRPENNILNYPEWHLKLGRKIITVKPEAHKIQGNGLLAKLPMCNDREEARLYTNALIQIPQELLPETEDDEFYWHDLIGLAVVNQEGAELGVVDHLFETGANDVMTVTKGKEERLIPFSKQHIIDIDHDQKRITVDWPEDF